MALKADMSKAYDRLNWNFIRGLLSYLNLPGSMVQLIMSTIESVSYEILLNGAPMEKVEPRCGIRQGDPLSPYIFTLCTEVLSQMILYAQDGNLIKGIKICKNGPKISHFISKWIEGYILHDLCGNFIDAPTDFTLLVGDFHDNHRRWDLSSLGFDPGEEVTKKILATYIPCQPSDDSFYWKFSKHGVFTIKSGYYVAAMALSNGPTSNADRFRMSAPIVTFCKSKLWKLPISNKLKVFLWKFMANALPVGSEFLKRKMDWRSFYSLCDESSPCVEYISHLFRDCSFAKALWFGCPLGLRITGGVDIDARVWVINWVTYFLIGPDPNSLLFPLIATLWKIWCCRNEMVFKNRRPWPLSALNFILDDIQCMNEAVSSKDVSLLRASMLDSSPVFGLAKRIRNSFPCWIVGGAGCDNVCTIKCDAAGRADRSSGMGWCLFDGNETLRNTAHARSFASSALHVMALKWALDEGYLHVRLVTDCLILVMQVVGAEKANASVKGIIHDLKSIASHFHCCFLSYCPRGVNRITHNLAQEALL
ncbi:uncharacterized protein LOC141637927 [Silene latifolia]|uniref:uncharacterized protein LOC141637927 n=1 Tax=Silene latifolia TaxID=37657 RepID=UPI003D775442